MDFHQLLHSLLYRGLIWLYIQPAFTLPCIKDIYYDQQKNKCIKNIHLCLVTGAFTLPENSETISQGRHYFHKVDGGWLIFLTFTIADRFLNSSDQTMALNHIHSMGYLTMEGNRKEKARVHRISSRDINSIDFYLSIPPIIDLYYFSSDLI